MANQVEEEAWEEVTDELLEEGDEEEEEQPPPGYRVADGPYKHFCTCHDKTTCSFCSWFHLIRDCQVHGKATQRPPKPCYCKKKRFEDLKAFSTEPTMTQNSIGRSQLLSLDSRLYENCECLKPFAATRCDCLDDVVSSSTDSAGKYDKPSGYNVSFNDIRGEDDITDDGGPVVEEDWQTDDFTIIGNVNSILRNVNPEREQTAQDSRPRPCTCDEEPKPRSGSSTELESSDFESSDADSSSQYDLDLFANLEEMSSSDITSSENSSADGADIDWTRVQWIHNASDRSVESVSDDDFEERKRRRAAAKKFLARPKRRRHTLQKKVADKPPRHQYLVVQQSRKKDFLDICKDKKDQSNSYSYRLMRMI